NIIVMDAALNGPFGHKSLEGGVVSIGRAPDNTIIITDSQSSGHHAEVRPEDQGYSVVDKGSTNGTYVNDQPLTAHVPRALAAGDRIRIGNSIITYESEISIAPTVYASPSFSGGPLSGGQPSGDAFSGYGAPPAYGAVPPTPPPPGYPQQAPGYSA